jgi:hypothetical protein
MLFGRAFEQALRAYFRREDPGDVLFREWSACKDQNLHFSNHDIWDRMLEQGTMLGGHPPVTDIGNHTLAT